MQDWTDFTAIYEHEYREATRVAGLANAAHFREFARPSLLCRVVARVPRIVHGLRPAQQQAPASAAIDGTVPDVR
jgi:hypothetical protein